MSIAGRLRGKCSQWRYRQVGVLERSGAPSRDVRRERAARRAQIDGESRAGDGREVAGNRAERLKKRRVC